MAPGEYEYKVISLYETSPSGGQEYHEWLAQELETHSQGGWELCAVDNMRFFFKRLKESSS